MTAPQPAPDPTDTWDDRPNAFEMLDGDLVLYDRTNPDAWIQSSASVDFAEGRAEISQ